MAAAVVTKLAVRLGFDSLVARFQDDRGGRSDPASPALPERRRQKLRDKLRNERVDTTKRPSQLPTGGLHPYRTVCKNAARTGVAVRPRGAHVAGNAVAAAAIDERRYPAAAAEKARPPPSRGTNR